MLTVSITHSLDGTALEKRTDKAKRTALSRQGAFIRRKALDLVKRARGSRRRKKKQQTLTPPRKKQQLSAAARVHVKEWYRLKKIREAAQPRPVSKPGDPPLSHGKSYRIRRMRFGYDPKTESVVAGPVIWPGSKTTRSLRALEEGGTSPKLDLEGKRLIGTTVIRPRPYMSKALEIEQANPRFMAVWEDSL